ncbi:uncharacterized protein LOC110823062 isoform X4 [Carica papaya]|uniref:uncharacterized protein LOC110823062 isoform X4 n=1 Tax=Carica papaya TaxID=3649 RepID=UPI000B8CBA98|nr:uncharacterized protein LOC110823062 isoform X4 [Carica papaya]
MTDTLGEKYEFWSIKMKTLFKSQDFWDLVEYGFVDLEDPDEEAEERLKETKKKDSKALFLVQQAVHEIIFSRIVIAATSLEAWQILKKEFQGSSKVKVEMHENTSRCGSGSGSGIGVFHEGGQGKGADRSASNEERQRKIFKCYYSNKPGCREAYCWKKQKDENNQASFAEEPDEERNLQRHTHYNKMV